MTGSGQDADLWKDSGWFAKKVTRYLCYSTDPRHTEYGALLVQVILAGGNESVPNGFEVIKTTVDTNEMALKDHMRILYKRLPLAQTSAVITDVGVFDQRSAHKPDDWQSIGVVNNLQIAVKQIPKRLLQQQDNVEDVTEELGSSNLSPSLMQSNKRSAKTRHTRAQDFSRNWSQDDWQAAKAVNAGLKLSPIHGLDYSLSRHINQGGGGGGAQSYTPGCFMHSPSQLQSYDFSLERSLV